LALFRNKIFVGSLTILLLGLAGLGVLVYLSRDSSNTSFKLSAPLGGSIELVSIKKLTVTSSEVGGLDSTSYFISSELGLAFKKPETPSEWSGVQGFDGLPPEQVSYVECLVGGQVGELVSRTLVQSAGPALRVAISPRTTIDVYGTKVPSGANKSCELPFRNAITVEVFPRSRLKKALGTDLSLPAFVGFAITQLGIRLDKLAANPSQILGTWTWRAHRARFKGKEDDFTQYRAFSFTQTAENFYVAEIAFSPDAESSPDKWSEMQKMLESFRLIGG
jgi:hypothetical protein